MLLSNKHYFFSTCVVFAVLPAANFKQCLCLEQSAFRLLLRLLAFLQLESSESWRVHLNFSYCPIYLYRCIVLFSPATYTWHFLLTFYITGLLGKWLEDYILLSCVCCVTKEQQNPKFYAKESKEWYLDPLPSLPHKKNHYKPKTHFTSIYCRFLSSIVGYWTIGLGEMMIYCVWWLKNVMWWHLPARRKEETDREESSTRSSASDRLASLLTRSF